MNPLIGRDIFDWMEFDETWKDAKTQRSLPILFFRADRKTKMAALASD